MTQSWVTHALKGSILTAILGQTGIGYVFLGTDTRRRNHEAGKITRVQKLHDWSQELLIAQGGAGLGAADRVLERLWDDRRAIGPSLVAVEKAIGHLAPGLLAEAGRKWSDAGMTMPVTRLVLASVCTETQKGMVRAIDLQTGLCDLECRSPQPYMSGSDTPAIIASASHHVANLLDPATGRFGFDLLVTRTIDTLGKSHGADIHLPADIGYVRRNAVTGEWHSHIVRGMTGIDRPDPDFSANLSF